MSKKDKKQNKDMKKGSKEKNKQKEDLKKETTSKKKIKVEENIVSEVEDLKKDEELKEEQNQSNSSDGSEDKVETEVSVEEKYAQLNDKYLRLSAEFDNYRKRTLKERMELIKSAGEDILVNFLPIVDNIERAKKSVEEAKEIEALKEGVDLIYKSLKGFLEQKGVKEIQAIGEDLNTDVHEALTKIPAPEESQKGKIIDIIEKGYKLNDKVIRFAKVVVGE